MSLDAKQLFQSLEIDATAKEISKEILESKVKFENIDYTTAARYIAANCGPIEVMQAGLSKIIPRRKYNKGVKPGVTTKELSGKDTSARKEKKDSHLYKL